MENKQFRKRNAILTCLRLSRDHPSAETVYTRLKPEYPDLSLGTVYRNLALFKDRGDIASLGTVDGVERFDGDVTPHAHFMCVRCGVVADLPDLTPPEALLAEAAVHTGASIRDCRVFFTGVCRECGKGGETG